MRYILHYDPHQDSPEKPHFTEAFPGLCLSGADDHEKRGSPQVQESPQPSPDEHIGGVAFPATTAHSPVQEFAWPLNYDPTEAMQMKIER